MNAFYAHHKDSIRFGYRCFDRILLNGLIQPFQQPERLVGFFSSYRQLYPVSHDVLRGAAEQFQAWVKEQADGWEAPIVEAPKGRRDEFVEPYFKGAKPDQVVVILKAREPARIMTAIGDRKTNRWHLQIAERLGRAIQLLCQRSTLGPDIRAHVSVSATLRSGLSQPTSLARQPYARGGHRLRAMLERLLAVQRTRAAPGTRRHPDHRRSVALRPHMAGTLHAVLQPNRASAIRMSTPTVLLAGRILRQPDLLPTRRTRRAWRAPARRQPHHRPAKQDHGHLRSQDHQAAPR